MATNFTIDTQRGVVFSGGTGIFRYSDYLEHLKKLVQDARFKPEFNQVIDCRRFELLDLSAEQIRELAEKTVFGPSSRHAFVVSTDHHFGLTRMFGLYRELRDNQTVGVFREMREALLWLNLPPDMDPDAAG